MDADDIMEPNRLERQIEFINLHPEIAVAISFVRYINADNKVIGKSTSEFTKKEKVLEYLNNNKLIGFSHPAVIFKKDVILEVGGYRPQFWPADDIDLWNRVAERGYDILVQPEYLLRYRIHSESVSIAGTKAARLKVHWLKECMICRRSGKQEPSWEEFLKVRQSMPLLQRINKERKDLAKTYYKAATFYYAQKKTFKFFKVFGKSVLLQPSYAIRQAIRKI
jgi:GT2 family glycosyltransferase